MIPEVNGHVPPSFSHSSLHLLEECTRHQGAHIGTAK